MTLEELLKNTPQARERKNRWRAIGRVLEKNFTLDMPIEKIMEIAQEATSLDRKYRKLQRENKELRGTDYDEEEIESESQNWQINNGYEVGYSRDIKQGKLIK